MGALCCVAAGPHGARSTTRSQDCSMDPTEPRWRTNSSFSPPLSRRWDCRFQSEALSHRVHDAPAYGSSLSSHSKGSRNELNSGQCPNHQHSVSDGALSYFGSPDTFQAPRWTAPLQKLDLAEFPTPSVGARPRPESSFSPRFSETRFTTRNCFQSPSQITEASGVASTSKHPILFPPRNFPGRRSFMSKPVYPIVFRNPVSEAETSGIAETSYGGRMTPDDDSRSSSMWHDSTLSEELKFQRGLTELQKMDASPDLGASSRREGFRWSNASSFEFGYDRDAIDITDHIGFESQRCPSNSLRYQKCGLCEKLLWQKSPWSSRRIVRSTDMPVAAILACGHVFHADCLEETTPKSQIHEPPCPLCQRVLGDDNIASFSEPLQVALRSVRRNQGENVAVVSAISYQNGGDLRRNQTLPQPWKRSSLIKAGFKKRFSFKGKMVRDLFGTKMFRKAGSSSSSMLPEGHSQAGSFKAS